MSQTLYGRNGFFLVVASDGTESGFLTLENADSEAESLYAIGQRFIYWHFIDEQEDFGKGLPVRHLVGPVPYTPEPPGGWPVSIGQREDISKRMADARNRNDHAEYDRLLKIWEGPKIEGVWQVCERWLLDRAASLGRPEKCKEKKRLR